MYSEGNLYMCKIGFAYFSVMASFYDHFSIGAFEAMTQKCCVWVWSLTADFLQFWSIFCQKSLKIHENEKNPFSQKTIAYTRENAILHQIGSVWACS